MQTAQRIIKSYRRNRIIVCVLVALFTLFLTLSFRFISQRNVNQDRIHAFANHSVNALDSILIPLESGREKLQSLVGAPCVDIHLSLRKQAATLQTVRSIGLIKDGILYLSLIHI